MLDRVYDGVSLVVCRHKILFGPEISDERRTRWQRYHDENSLRARFNGTARIGRQDFARHLLQFPDMNCIGAPTATLLRKSVFRDFGSFIPHMIQLVDWEFWARIAVRDGISYVDESLARYRIHDRSMSARNSMRRNYRVKVLDPLIIRHELAYSGFYGQVREIAESLNPPVNLRHELVRSARDAYEIAHARAVDPLEPDPRPLADWNELLRYYPRIASVPPSYLIRSGLRIAKRNVHRVRELARSFLALH